MHRHNHLYLMDVSADTAQRSLPQPKLLHRSGSNVCGYVWWWLKMYEEDSHMLHRLHTHHSPCHRVFLLSLLALMVVGSSA